MHAARTGLSHLDRREWWRLAAVLAVSVALTGGVFILSVAVVRRDFLEELQLQIAVRSLIAAVLLFDVFAIYQQIVIMRLRRQLASQMGMMATLELLRAPTETERPGWLQRRRFQRVYFDQRLTVKRTGDVSEAVQGRTRDISEGGLGAVLPCDLNPGDLVMVEFASGTGNEKISANGIVRHRRGFYHGLEFLGMTPAQRGKLRDICSHGAPVEFAARA